MRLTFGGLLCNLLEGFKFSGIGKWQGFELKPVLKKVKIPDLIVMILLGFIVRNFGGDTVRAYPPKIAGWCQNLVLGIGAVRAGLSLTFKGKMLIMALLVLVP